MKLATWNMNSIRLRMGLLKDFVDGHGPDIVCIQETKVHDHQFPLDDVKALGFDHVIYRGEKGYNGVAILSKLPLDHVQRLDIVGDGQARHISAQLPSGIELHNFYVPAGGDEPDIDINPKFKHKLDYVDAMHDWFQTASSAPRILVGDLNIAPYEHDVWSHKQLLSVVSHTPVEVEKLLRLRDGLAWVDVGRHFVPEDQKLYSWWSYRNRDWKKSNRGRRLDHIWVTPDLKDQLHAFDVVEHARDWERPSDHVPVMMHLQEVA